ncbi:hypothetical protein HPG69_015938 [Diceros bicornis minor]|uniref:Rho family GTPase 2 n=1 Tax=Diceros bicornis minor TaxID=77932 RepID=A0A7J7EQS0_DICBM|nr:hypothetical protein HPG69_015938 [Diceros bicornis minor]
MDTARISEGLRQGRQRRVPLKRSQGSQGQPGVVARWLSHWRRRYCSHGRQRVQDKDSETRSRPLPPQDQTGSSGRCKIVVVGDAECGKTALLQVFAKDAYPGSYVPTVFENYTASFEIDKRRIELNMWDTSGSSYYDNVRPLAYPDSDAVLICFDISRPETLDSVLKKWQGETQEFCPNAKVVLVGCKLDMRTDLATLRELSKQRLIPVTHEQGTVLAKQVGAVSYVECSSRSSERSVRDVFHVATVASLGRGHRQLRRTDSRRGLQRSTQLAGRPDQGNGNGTRTEGEIHKDRAKSCNLMTLSWSISASLLKDSGTASRALGTPPSQTETWLGASETLLKDTES